MPVYQVPALPSEDKRWRIVNGTMRRHGYSRNALIETLAHCSVLLWISG